TIECVKRIPVAAGLGGGSADAAATLRALSELWGVGLPAVQLAGLGAQLGADVPFQIEGGTVLATGTGTQIMPLPDAPSHWVVLVPLASDESEKTAEMYGRLSREDFSNAQAAHLQADAIKGGRVDYASVRSSFDRPARERWPRTASALLG